MNYGALLQKLYNLKGSGLELESVLARLGNPQQGLRTVRVAGTNGKGSVCVFVAQILQEAGFRVGLYTSPHLVRPEERIQINRQEIASADFQREFERIWAVIAALYGEESEQRARFFEVLTLMALDYFAQQEVDWAVIECGVGARRDATRVVHPQVSVLTNVALDHTETLGPTIAQIAYEKAAVVAPRGVLITGEHKPEALAEIERECARKEARLIQLNLGEIRPKAENWEGQVFDWHDWPKLAMAILGTHQRANAVLALVAALALEEPRLDEHAVRRGLKSARWPGRMELLQKKPYVMLDGAKNPAGLRALREALAALDYERLILILGIADRKDAEAMLSEIVPAADEVIATKAAFRGIAPELLAQKARAYSKPCWAAARTEAALAMALARAQARDLVCVTGSLFLVGEAQAWWRARCERSTRH